MENINKYGIPHCALWLINEHTIGDLRDEADLDISKYHSLETINFAIDFFKEIEGTTEEKIEFLLKVKE